MDISRPRSGVTYILPTVDSAVLLDPIAGDAPAGSVLEVDTEDMHALCRQTLERHGRTDMTVVLRTANGRRVLPECAA